MLQNCSFQDIFARGCMFRLRLIKLGRLMEGPSLSKQPELLKRLIYRDIQMMPDELRLLEPLCSRSSQNVAKIQSRTSIKEAVIEIVANGTNIMKKISLTTVLIKI